MEPECRPREVDDVRTIAVLKTGLTAKECGKPVLARYATLARPKPSTPHGEPSAVHESVLQPAADPDAWPSSNHQHGRQTRRDCGVLVMGKLIAWGVHVLPRLPSCRRGHQGTGGSASPCPSSGRRRSRNSRFTRVRTRALGTAVPSRASPGDHGHRPAVLRRDERRGKLVFSRTLRSAEGVNTTIAAG